MPEYIAYAGEKFTIEWYFDAKDKSQPLEYFEDITESQQDKFLFLLKTMGDIGKVNNKEKFRNEGDGIYAFKVHPDRYLCFFFKDQKIIITNAFAKKQKKLPKKEKNKALNHYDDYVLRIEKGEYYHD